MFLFLNVSFICPCSSNAHICKPLNSLQLLVLAEQTLPVYTFSLHQHCSSVTLIVSNVYFFSAAEVNDTGWRITK